MCVCTTGVMPFECVLLWGGHLEKRGYMSAVVVMGTQRGIQRWKNHLTYLCIYQLPGVVIIIIVGCHGRYVIDIRMDLYVME